MISAKKLSTIRDELRRALARNAEDPIRWLEERMAAAAHQAGGPADTNEVLESLRRILAARPARQKRTPAATKERTAQDR